MFAAKPEGLASVSGTHMVEGEKPFLSMVLWSLHRVCGMMCALPTKYSLIIEKIAFEIVFLCEALAALEFAM